MLLEEAALHDEETETSKLDPAFWCVHTRGAHLHSDGVDGTWHPVRVPQQFMAECWRNDAVSRPTFEMLQRQ